MKIGILTHAFPPHPPDAVTDHYEKAARGLARAGHEVHVITNHAWYGATKPELTSRYWKEGNLHIHRLPLLDEGGSPPPFLRFFDADPGRYRGRGGDWVLDPFHLAALHLAEFAQLLFTEEGLDVLEAPHEFGEAFYAVRRRKAGGRGLLPPVSLTLFEPPGDGDPPEEDPAALGSPGNRRASRRKALTLAWADGILAFSPRALARADEEGAYPPGGIRSALASPDDLEGLAAHLEKVASLGGEGPPPEEGPFRLPPRLLPGLEPPPLPGSGVILVDRGGASPESRKCTLKALEEAVRTSPGWQVHLFGFQDGEGPPSWKRVSPGGPYPWEGRKGKELFLYVLAGARPDPGALLSLAELAQAGGDPPGSFLWTRPADMERFPYRPDLGFHEVLLGAGILPAVFCVLCSRLEGVKGLERVSTPAGRIAALLGAAASRCRFFLHTGRVQGDFYGDLPLLTPASQAEALGLLELLGLLPADLVSPGNLDYPGPPKTPDPAGPTSPGGIPLEVLESTYQEHQNLKNLLPVRILRKLGVLDLLRKIAPGTKKVLGPGN